MIRSRSLAAVVAILLASIAMTSSPVSAKPKDFIDTSTMLPSERMAAASNAIEYGEAHQRRPRQRASLDANGNTVIGHRPPGCPHAFCGCEASLYIFGKIRAELNLASNWIRKFPRAAPAPGMAAARSGHVMVLMRHVEGNNWLVHDGNSGGGKTREHVRSITGYVIVNPRGGNYAALAQ